MSPDSPVPAPFHDRSETLRAGDRAPEFRLPTADGREISLEEYRGRTTLVFFLRGTWCPNCRKLMARLNDDWEEFSHRNLGVVLIAAQKIRGMFKASQFVREHPYPFPILFDEKRRVVKAYGVFRLAGLDAFRIAHPAVFVLDPDQIIRWIAVSPNQWERPSTAQILEAVEATLRKAG